MRRSRVLLAALALVAFSGFSGSSAGAATISLAQLGPIQAGQQFDVAVAIDLGSDSLYAFNVNVLYDASRFDVVAVQFGDPVLGNQLELTGPSPFTHSAGGSPGSLTLFDWSQDSASAIDNLQESSFRLATVRFEADASASGSAGFDPYACAGCLNRPGGGAVPVDGLVGFTASIQGGSTMPEPGAALLFAVGMGVVALRARRQR